MASIFTELTRPTTLEKCDKKIDESAVKGKYARIKDLSWEEIVDVVFVQDIFNDRYVKVGQEALRKKNESWLRMEDIEWFYALYMWGEAHNIPDILKIYSDALNYAAGVFQDRALKDAPRLGVPLNEDSTLRFKSALQFFLSEFAHILMEGMVTFYPYYRWTKSNRLVYAYSPLFAEMLSNTRLDNLPGTQLRLPHRVMELVFPDNIKRPFSQPDANGKGMRTLNITGAFVEEWGENDESRGIRVEMLSSDTRKHVSPVPTSVYGYKFPLRGDEPLSESVKRLRTHLESLTPTSQWDRPHDMLTSWDTLENLFYFIVATLVYVTTKDADLILGANSPLYQEWVDSMRKRKLNRKRRREVTKIRSRVEDAPRHFLGQSFKVIDRHNRIDPDTESSDVPGTRKKRHWRVGHFHHYWMNKEDESGDKELVQKWVLPVLVNPDLGHGPIESKTGMR